MTLSIHFFCADWAKRQCDPYREVVKTVSDRLNFALVEHDYDTSPMAVQFRVPTIPTVLLLDETEPDPLAWIVGMRSAADLESLLAPHTTG